jgi:hypothetical protein
LHLCEVYHSQGCCDDSPPKRCEKIQHVYDDMLEREGISIETSTINQDLTLCKSP